jgi:hypothetical protein
MTWSSKEAMQECQRDAARKAGLESKKQAYESELTIGTAVEAPGATAIH